MLGSTQYPWEVTAYLQKSTGSHPDATLIGTTTIKFRRGWANFTDLGISHSGSGYSIEFRVTNPPEGYYTYYQKSELVTLSERQLAVSVVQQPSEVKVGEDISLGIQLVDKVTGERVDDIGWKVL